MITDEHEQEPDDLHFDVVLVAVGYESRCRWVWSERNISATVKVGLEFGFLTGGAYGDNRVFFESDGFVFANGVTDESVGGIVAILRALEKPVGRPISALIDISSMSREMIANAILAVNHAFCGEVLAVTAAYAPSQFEDPGEGMPIRVSRPIKRALSGWSARPEQPLGAIFGLGCEPGLALGALQVLEPDKAWLFYPKGIDARFEQVLITSNYHINDIFDVTRFEYEIGHPALYRGRFEALLNSIEKDYRVITVPFGPKGYAWAVLATIIFSNRSSVGVWTFSSRDHGTLKDRCAEGPIIWHTVSVSPRMICAV